MHKATYGLLVALLFCACSPTNNSNKRPKGEQQKIHELHEKVMEIHDEVMPKISEIKKLSKTLSKQLPAITESSPVSKEQVEKCINFLDAADKGMFDWMAQYKMPKDSQNFNDAENYLKEQIKSISIVRDDMLESIAEGQKLSSSLGVNE